MIITIALTYDFDIHSNQPLSKNIIIGNDETAIIQWKWKVMMDCQPKDFSNANPKIKWYKTDYFQININL